MKINYKKLRNGVLADICMYAVLPFFSDEAAKVLFKRKGVSDYLQKEVIQKGRVDSVVTLAANYLLSNSLNYEEDVKFVIHKSKFSKSVISIVNDLVKDLTKNEDLIAGSLRGFSNKEVLIHIFNVFTKIKNIKENSLKELFSYMPTSMNNERKRILEIMLNRSDLSSSGLSFLSSNNLSENIAENAMDRLLLHPDINFTLVYAGYFSPFLFINKMAQMAIASNLNIKDVDINTLFRLAKDDHALTSEIVYAARKRLKEIKNLSVYMLIDCGRYNILTKEELVSILKDKKEFGYYLIRSASLDAKISNELWQELELDSIKNMLVQEKEIRC